MSDPAYRTRAQPADFGGLFAPQPVQPTADRRAVDEPPRRTRKQTTRWATQDAAYASAPTGIAARIMESLRQSPATCDELEQRLQLTHQTCSAAVNQLMNAGAIRAHGARPTRSGRAARVWEAMPTESGTQPAPTCPI